MARTVHKSANYLEGAALVQPTFVVPALSEAEKMTWFTTNTAAGYTSTTPSKVKIEAFIWDDTEAYVNWQLANVKTSSNDKTVGALDKYTDGYAMQIRVEIGATYCQAAPHCGVCLEADGAGASCILWEGATPTTIDYDYSFWVPSADFITTTNALDDLYIRA